MPDRTADGVILLLDAGPLITLAYADSLDLLQAPGWPVKIVDMVQHEVTRRDTPSSARIAGWLSDRAIPVLTTRTCTRYLSTLTASGTPPRKANLGELAAQEVMNDLALGAPETRAVFLFEDHKIARASFLIPDNCMKISTRAFLLFLEGRGLIDSAASVEQAAIANGRHFSRLRFPPDVGE